MFSPVFSPPRPLVMQSPSASPAKTRPSFQLTSAESFEASLMAGGYGLYVCFHCHKNGFLANSVLPKKTAEWVRQPSVPGDIPMPASVPGPSKPPIFKKPEYVLPPPLSEKQLRKKRRVDKFRINNNGGGSRPYQRLLVGELRGIGRVILDETPPNGVYTEATAIAAARRPAEERRRKKIAADAAMRERERKEALTVSYEDCPTQPNWPDDDFPWRLSEERRLKLLKEDRELRMRYIEEFFAGDTDDEDEVGGGRSKRIA
ncbi:hypothetical protein MIND_00889900 [Mycena indigotica]|uniref:Uncharacterized protein n=1 Tax=Mycena indigotica TaxID=2126181 RepID=A0A8H6VZF7_9AGAR|nr:uncharacterized protein MIND_00889900 [Mycena indigotica]KAF7299402.1 hypothetical protein MIND_00889900 [Mycena indigotica]